MKGIPPEIDRLMWTVAEQESPSAAEEFLSRYPIYREELMRRRDAVSGLRKSRPAKAAPARSVPRFTPRESRRPSPTPRQVAIVSGLVLAAVAAASYTVTALLAPSPKTEPPVVTPTNPPVVQEYHPPKVDPPTSSPETTPSPPESETPKQAPIPKYLQPQSLVVRKATLPDVLRLLEAQAGVKIVIAPGMPSPTISVEYHDMNAVEMLQDLGARYKFTPFDQGDGSIVVYPAVDAGGGSGPGNLRPLGG